MGSCGAFIFTLIITCISLIRPDAIPNKSQQRKLFTTLIVELVVICLGSFSNFLTFAPREVQEDIATKAAENALAQRRSPTPTAHSATISSASATPSPVETPAPSAGTRTITMKVVLVHVGGDNSQADTFSYEAPPGYSIKS